MAVANEGELEALTQQGLARRTVAPTCANAASSRSHCLITLTVQRRLPDGGLMHGKLTLVDLAGINLILGHPCHPVPCGLAVSSALPDTWQTLLLRICLGRWKPRTVACCKMSLHCDASHSCVSMESDCVVHGCPFTENLHW